MRQQSVFVWSPSREGETQKGKNGHLGGLLHDIGEGVEVGVGAGNAVP